MAGLRLIATRRFAVYGNTGENGLGDRPALEQSSSSTSRSAVRSYGVAAGMTFEKDEPEIEVPTMRLRELNKSNASRFVGLLEKHGFVVLTEVGAVRKAYLEFMQLLKAFFEREPDWKETKKGGVHFNERGIPMWHTGYERCGRVREAFRIPTELARASSSSSSSSSSQPSTSRDPWPCQHLRRAWLAVLRHLQLVCHRALTLTLARPVHGAPPSVRGTRRPAAASSQSATATRKEGGEGRVGGGVGGGERGGGKGGREGGEGGREGDNRESECCLPVGLDRIEVAPKEAAEVAAAEAAAAAAVVAAAATVGTEATGAAQENGQAEGQAGDEHKSQGSGERGSEERCPASLSQAPGTSDEGVGGGSDAGNDVGSDGEGGDAAGDDFSVSYALHYPNEFADPALEKEDLTVGEHVDPSLFVAEPCCGVEGLEILDRASKSWLPVEALCAGLGANGKHGLAEAEGRELVLFGGKALERATEGRVRGAPHRVRRGKLGRRYCFIYEQKYAEFFPPPALD